jgi:tetratricopeptide (TPR) repeat protein
VSIVRTDTCTCTCMSLFNAIRNALGRRSADPTASAEGWAEGYRRFQRGKEHYLAGGEDHSNACRIEEALSCFDSAIALGFEEGGIYSTRGSCLQILGYDLDAIDDFDRAIAEDASDCNLFFMRSVSKGAIGDLRGRVSDLKEAMRLAATDNTTNRSCNALALKRGYREGVVSMCAAEMRFAEQDVESQQFYERLLRESPRPGLADQLGADLVARRRAKARRRPHGNG